MLVRRGLPLAIAAIELPDDAEPIDLDDPVVLRRRRLSAVGRRHARPLHYAAAGARRLPTDAAGLRWWSILESLWANYTIFDRASPRLTVQDVRVLALEDAAVVEAADYLGLS